MSSSFPRSKHPLFLQSSIEPSASLNVRSLDASNELLSALDRRRLGKRWRAPRGETILTELDRFPSLCLYRFAFQIFTHWQVTVVQCSLIADPGQIENPFSEGGLAMKASIALKIFRDYQKANLKPSTAGGYTYLLDRKSVV